MAANQKKGQIRLTLPLIALCLPLFVKHYVTAENGCPFETYIRVSEKCIDISEDGLNEITTVIDSDVAEEIHEEVEEVSQELEELSAELEEFCIHEQPETSEQVEVMEDVCQY